jgi:predicted protein tyrosine phosphatase
MNKINLLVCNRINAASVEIERPFSVISVYTPEETKNVFLNRPENILYLCFSDCSSLDLAEFDSDIVMFSDIQAKSILNFVNYEISKGVNNFLIHCDAGISRSPGIAVALNEIYNGIKTIRGEWRLYNSFVYRKIMENFYTKN